MPTERTSTETPVKQGPAAPVQGADVDTQGKGSALIKILKKLKSKVGWAYRKLLNAAKKSFNDFVQAWRDLPGWVRWFVEQGAEFTLQELFQAILGLG